MSYNVRTEEGFVNEAALMTAGGANPAPLLGPGAFDLSGGVGAETGNILFGDGATGLAVFQGTGGDPFAGTANIQILTSSLESAFTVIASDAPFSGATLTLGAVTIGPSPLGSLFTQINVEVSGTLPLSDADLFAIYVQNTSSGNAAYVGLVVGDAV